MRLDKRSAESLATFRCAVENALKRLHEETGGKALAMSLSVKMEMNQGEDITYKVRLEAEGQQNFPFGLGDDEEEPT